MGNIFLVLYFSHFALFVLSERTTTLDGKNQAIHCYTEMSKDGQITNLLIDVTTPERIDEFCSRISSLMKCTAEYEHHLANDENTSYLRKTAGVRNFFINVCPPGTDITRQYKGNSPCFRLIKRDVLHCGSDLPDMESYKMRRDKIARCCALLNHRECVTNVTSEKCGQEAGHVVDQIIQRYFEPQRTNCPKLSSQQCFEIRYSTVPYWTSSPYRHGKGKISKTPVDEYSTSKPETEWEDEWSQTTVAEEWKKHKGKNEAFSVLGGNHASILIVLVSTAFQYSLSKR